MDTQTASHYMRSMTQFLGWVVQLNIVLFFLNLTYQLAKKRLENATGRGEDFGNVLEHYLDKLAEGATSIQSRIVACLPTLAAAKNSARSWLESLIPPKPVAASVAKKQPCRRTELQQQVRQLQEQIHGHQDQLHQLRWALDQLEEDHQTRNVELEENLALERADLARFYEGVLVSQRHELQQAAAQQAAADEAQIRDLENQTQHLMAQLRDREAPSSAADSSRLLVALKEQTKQTRELQRALAAARARAEDRARAAQAEGARRRQQARRLRAACVRLRAELRAEQERLGRGYLADTARDYVPMEGVVA